MNTRKLAGGLLAIGIVAALTVGGSTAAVAASPVTPLSVLPSQIVSGTTPTTGGALADAQAVRMAQVWKFVTSPDVVAALKSQQAGTATKTETDLIAAAAKNIKIPTGVGTLVKGAGAAGVAYTGYTIGTSVGSLAADGITTSLWGIDANSLVCGAAEGVGQGFLSFFAGQDCSAFNARPDQPINTDATGGGPSRIVIGAVSTTPDGKTSATLIQMLPSRNCGGENCYVAEYKSYDGGSGGAAIPGDPKYWWFASGSFVGNSNQYDPGYGARDDNTRYMLFGDRVNGQTPIAWRAAEGASISDAQAPSADPNRYISCDITGTDGSYQSVAGATFTETMTDWSSAVPGCPTLPAEVLPDTTTLTLHTVGGADQVLWTSKLPPETADAMTGKYKTCLTTVCQLILKKGGVSCFDGADCTGWATDPNRESTYTCEYAGQGVALSECIVYSPTWEPDALRTGQVYGDPVTGKPGLNSPDKIEQGSAPVKGTDSAAMSPTVSDDRGECFPTGWGVFNPVEWVVKPLKCAFSPRASVVNETLTTIQKSGDGKAPAQLQSAIAGYSFNTPTGCDGIHLPKSILLPEGITVMQACPGDMLRPMAILSQIFCTLGVTVAGFLSIRGSIAGVAEYRGGTGA